MSNDSVAERVASRLKKAGCLAQFVDHDGAYTNQAELVAVGILSQALADNAAKDRRIGELEAKLDFLKAKGLTVTTAKTSDRPEPYLVYVIEEGSELCDGRTIAKLTDAESKLAAVEAGRDGLREDLSDADTLLGEGAVEIAKLRTELTALRQAAEGAKEFCDRVHDGAEDSAWWAKEAGLHLEKLKAALK